METKIYRTFETERLILKPTTIAESAFVLELLNTPKWLQYIGDRNVHTIEEAAQYITSRMTPHLEQHGFGNYTLVRKSDGALIGTTGIYNRDGLDAMDIGFALLTQYEGMGYGYESASILMKAAFEEFGLSELVAITTVDNLASQKLLLNLGLVNEGPITMPDDDAEMLLFRIRKV